MTESCLFDYVGIVKLSYTLERKLFISVFSGHKKKKGERMRPYYLVTETHKQGFYVKARYLGEFSNDDEAADAAREELGSSLAPDEFVLTEEEIRENYGNEAAEMLRYIDDEGYIIDE